MALAPTSPQSSFGGEQGKPCPYTDGDESDEPKNQPITVHDVRLLLGGATAAVKREAGVVADINRNSKAEGPRKSRISKSPEAHSKGGANRA